MVVTVVGAVKANEVFDFIEGAFGDWEKPKQESLPELPSVGQPKRLLRKVTTLPGKSQCDIVVGTPGPSRLEQHYLAAALGNNILGRFGMYGRIGDAVRESAGLAYYAYSTLSGGLGPGPWQVIAGVNPIAVDQAIELIRDEIRRFVTQKVAKSELTENQANFIGRLPIQLESNEGVAGAILHVEKFGLGLDYFQNYPQLVASITRDEIIQTANRFLDPDRMVISIAGPMGEGGGA
jgi:zinc protease